MSTVAGWGLEEWIRKLSTISATSCVAFYVISLYHTWKMMETWCCPPSNVCNTLTNNSWSRQIYTRLSNRHIVKLYNYSILIEQRNFPGILKLSLCLIQEYFDVYIRGHQICIIESSNSD